MLVAAKSLVDRIHDDSVDLLLVIENQQHCSDYAESQAPEHEVPAE